MSFKRWDVVVVPFPFVDSAKAKRRPALVVSHAAFQRQSRHCVLAMITTQRQPAWPGDTDIKQSAAAGLKAACLVRMKLFTLDERLILRKIGALSPSDSKRVALQLSHCLG